MKMINEMSEGFGTYNFMYGIFRGKDESIRKRPSTHKYLVAGTIWKGMGY